MEELHRKNLAQYPVQEAEGEGEEAVDGQQRHLTPGDVATKSQPFIQNAFKGVSSLLRSLSSARLQPAASAARRIAVPERALLCTRPHRASPSTAPSAWSQMLHKSEW